MNERQALDLASEHGVPVTTDRRTKAGISFKVGRYTISRSKGSSDWHIDRGFTTYRRGEAMKEAIDWILAAVEADQTRNISLAEVVADASGLPQTVFRTPDTNGWTCTNALAGILKQQRSEVLVTILPRRYYL